MIIRDQRERFDGSWRILQYDPEADGRLAQGLREPDSAAELHVFYELREKETRRLLDELLGGRISPLAFHMELNRMTVEDAAARVGVFRSTVRKHMTPGGFGRARVDTLRRYARLFDLSVADFFSVVRASDAVAIASSDHQDRLVQCLRVEPRG